MPEIQNAFQLLSDRTGRLIDAGRVYIGVVNEDPEVAPIAVFWDADLTIAAAQPLQTVAGYIVRDGAPSRVFAATPYSMRVRQQNGGEVYYDPNSAADGDEIFGDFDGGIDGEDDGQIYDGGLDG